VMVFEEGNTGSTEKEGESYPVRKLLWYA